MKNLLNIFLCLTLLSCGARKASVTIQKEEMTDISNDQSKGQVSTGTGKIGTDTQTSNSSDVTDQQDKRITELFNENGTLKSRMTELLNSKRVITNNTTINKTFHEYVFTDSTFNNTIYRKQTITKYDKSKTTNRNSSIWIVLSGLAGLALGVWISPKVARWFGK